MTRTVVGLTGFNCKYLKIDQRFHYYRMFLDHALCHDLMPADLMEPVLMAISFRNSRSKWNSRNHSLYRCYY